MCKEVAIQVPFSMERALGPNDWLRKILHAPGLSDVQVLESTGETPW